MGAASAGCNCVGAKGKDEHHVHIQAKLHHGAVERKNFFRGRELRAEVFGGCAKLLFFVFLTDEGFHHADALHIFLNRAIQRVIFAEHAPKDRECLTDDEIQPDAKHRNDHDEDQRELSAHEKRHDHREDQHERTSDCNTDEHHKCVLHVAHVCGQPRYQ
ncbi:hypothetical protein SDC9_91102 [bioreactor metagenome]|uniref:Uncharacterized protein n=1 Tax=bioreactor metagenome TaxID=1076179 RepID=A0A645A3Q7_9ZZZZ